MSLIEAELSRKLVLLAGLVVSVGCGSNSKSGASLSEPEVHVATPLKIDLPLAPSFADPDVPPIYPDGTRSIRGIRKQRTELLGKEVKIKALLLQIYKCPGCPKGRTCKPCDQPHFFLGDKAFIAKGKELMVVDYLSPAQRPPALTIGKRYIVSGQFQLTSPSGFGSSEGLLVFSQMVDDKGSVYTSPAQRAKQKEAAVEAIEAALSKKREAATFRK